MPPFAPRFGVCYAADHDVYPWTIVVRPPHRLLVSCLQVLGSLTRVVQQTGMKLAPRRSNVPDIYDTYTGINIDSIFYVASVYPFFSFCTWSCRGKEAAGEDCSLCTRCHTTVLLPLQSCCAQHSWLTLVHVPQAEKSGGGIYTRTEDIKYVLTTTDSSTRDDEQRRVYCYIYFLAIFSSGVYQSKSLGKGDGGGGSRKQCLVLNTEARRHGSPWVQHRLGAPCNCTVCLSLVFFYKT